jgi:UDPglucose 6-dehydrogenase
MYNTTMNVAVVGTGYVGLVTGACLAKSGHTVVCIDNNQQKVAELRAGKLPIYEPDLAEIVSANADKGRLSFTTDLAEGVSQAEVIFLALPTPPQEDGSADLSAVMAVAKQLGGCLAPHYCVVVNKSTVPVGTAEAVQATIAGQTDQEFDVVSNPEFLREGFAVRDFMEPERVVVGASSDRAADVMRQLYSSYVNDERPLLVTDPATAELTKYAANTFLVTKISFMNEIAQLCERMGADVDMVRQALGADSRIGHKFLYPGIGCGGSCFPKDVRALKHMSKQYNYDFKLLAAAIQINDQQKHVLVDKLLDHFEADIAGKHFALWGLAFKPGTDDIREAPALVIIDSLLAAGASVTAYDPEAGKHVRTKYADNDQVTITDDKYEALGNASALLVATEWPEFADGNLETIGNLLQERLVFDGRNIFQTEVMRAAGFSYYSIGRRPVLSSN